MSPRTDSYLSLCLEQASKSPLHYRHGSIIVRGGKVIGQGYNDYRPGFNGGALKTGRLTSTTNGPAIAELKQKRQGKKLPTQPDARLKGHEAAGTFTPFEMSANGGGGRGHLANTPLSMHSEMMAIHSALSLSGTLACPGSVRSARSLQKPCFKLPGRGKRRLRLRGLKTYVEAVCAAAELQQQQQREGFRSEGDCVVKGLRINAVDKGKDKGKEVGNDDKGGEKVRSKKEREREKPRTTQTMLIPQGRTGSNPRSIAARTQPQHLKGADLYVARLGRKMGPTPSQPAPQPQLHNNPNSTTAPSTANPSPTNPPSATPSPPPPTSLHDELRTLTVSNPPRRTDTDRASHPLASVGASRPCYRCIAYMHAVGIKRVFWTDANGGWEGGKVRDLVDALEMAGSSAGGPGSAGGEGDGRATGKGEGVGVFVTKHEVLMLRRLMGGT